MPQAYSQKAIVEWFHRTLGVDSVHNNEIKTKCPVCDGEVFYFNIRKKVGICHKASCGFTPKLEQLIELVGFAPDEAGVWEHEEKAPKEIEVVLPGVPILQQLMGQLMTSNEDALAYLRGRGIDDQTILNWELTCDGDRIYVPIRYEGKLVNFNSRLLPHHEGKKYLYCPGAKTSHYILGWEECKEWEKLTLVENTFVSLAYRKKLLCSTTFGSNISDVQADMIGRANIRSVALLWDQGAEKNAARSVRKLHARGVRAAYWSIKGQPDDYPMEWVMRQADKVHDAAYDGVDCVVLMKEFV